MTKECSSLCLSQLGKVVSDRAGWQLCHKLLQQKDDASVLLYQDKAEGCLMQSMSPQ